MLIVAATSNLNLYFARLLFCRLW